MDAALTAAGLGPWAQLGIVGAPMSYTVDGKQYVAIAGGWTMYVFGLP